METKEFRTFEDLQDYLDDWAYGEDESDVCEFLESIGAHYSDEGIYDGIEPDEEYIMYTSYDIVFDEKNHWIKFYYSNLDGEVTDIEYR